MLEERQDVTDAIESIADIMVLLAELEAASEQMVDVYFQKNTTNSTDDDQIRLGRVRRIVGDVERQARSIRSYLTRLYATVVMRNTIDTTGSRNLERLGFEGYIGQKSVEISIPYHWISVSSAFIYTLKKYPQWNSLTSATDVWHWVMEEVLRRLEPHVPFELPLERADIEIVMFKPRSRLGDPDHFWYRSIIDTFVQKRFIVNDDAQSLHISVGYEHDPDHPELRIRLTELGKSYQAGVREESLQRIF